MKKTNTPLTLGTENVKKLLLHYSIPSIIGMMAMSVYNITDSIFIGHGVGPLALAGLAITFPIMNLAAAFGSFVGVGGASLMSLRLGQKDFAASEVILGNVITLNLLIGISFSLIILSFLEPTLIFFGASERILPYAKDFMIIILLGNVATHLHMGLNSLIRSDGQPNKAMLATIATVFLNLMLNPLFIFKFGWGIMGSALATIIAQVIVVLWEIYFFASGKSFVKLKMHSLRLNKDIIKGIFSIGISPFILNAGSCMIVILANMQFETFGGDLAVGAYGIVNRVSFLFVMIIFGLNQGMQPIAGYNYGAGFYLRVKDVLKKSILAAVLIMTFGLILCTNFSHFIASLFTSEQKLIDITVKGLRIVFLSFPLVGFQMVASTFFQSIGQSFKTIFLTLSRQWIFLIPLILILPHFYAMTGVWVSMPIADTISGFMSMCLLFHGTKKLKEKR
ncbi:MAG: MATE family efflux transporter [Elusimicrobiota bacterium]|jgi:putative MATE family efflux protein|nr:MATE family efflux transporter [Elusimicrobiota bacterium]